MSRIHRGRSALAVAATLLLAGTAAAFSVAIQPKRGVPMHRTSYEIGKQIFFTDTFGGNGRTCATCHVPRNEFTISPKLVQERFALDPSDPLFRAIDSDDGHGKDFSTMLAHAVFRVAIPLHDDVRVVDDPQRRVIEVWRGVPALSNLALTAPYQQDGRADTLQAQARGAIRDHMQPKRRQFGKEVDALRNFLVELVYPLRAASLLDLADPIPKAPGFSVPVESPAALRGKDAFDLHCRRCHGGELGHVPDDPTLPQFADVFVSDVNAPGFPFFMLAFKQPDGSEVVVFTPDPGRGALTGQLADLNAFDIPSLRGVKHTAPYFHDNSAGSLREVVDHYDAEFQFQLSPDEIDDLISYLELL